MVGDIVLTPFPYTDLSSSKIRPAVVVADVGSGDWVLCEITSSPQNRPGNIAITQEDMQTGRIQVASQVRPDRLHTLNQLIFRRTIGTLSVAKQSQVLAAVRNLF